MERKSPLFNERACMILEEIFEDGDDAVIPFRPPAANSEIGAEPMEMDDAPSRTEGPSRTEAPAAESASTAVNPASSDSCGSPVGSDNSDETQDNEETEEDVVVMAKPYPYLRLYHNKRCEGCKCEAPDQRSHMQYRGCLAEPVNDDNDGDDDNHNDDDGIDNANNGDEDDGDVQ